MKNSRKFQFTYIASLTTRSWVDGDFTISDYVSYIQKSVILNSNHLVMLFLFKYYAWVLLENSLYLSKSLRPYVFNMWLIFSMWKYFVFKSWYDFCRFNYLLCIIVLVLCILICYLCIRRNVPAILVFNGNRIR